MRVSKRNQRDPVRLTGGLPSAPLRRVCPRCDAKPGHACTRALSKDSGAYYVTLKYPHRERRKKREARDD